MASLSLRHIYKIYQGGVRAVSDFNLEIEDKEFIVFVGPSGCGKSTTLRMVAGLEEISAGELYIDGKLVNDVEPKDRDIAMVFQNYALYPHMTVYDNMAFGLRLRKMNSQDIDARVHEAAQILGIEQLLSRKPKALSGGQRQRVALGRAIVREPKVFLLDEPLSNLDAKLRVQMRTEITKLHNKLATTFIYVTHDQTEAMTMGTRIVVMKDGVIQQVDTPTCLYDHPENLFVASFLGSPQMNFFNAKLIREDGDLYAEFGVNKIKVPKSRAKRLMDESFIGKDVILGVRPEDIHDEEIFIKSSPDSIITAEIDVIEKLGNETILYMKVDGKEDYTIARIDARSTAQQGETLKLAVDSQHIHFFDPETELTIMGVPRVNMIPSILKSENGGLTVTFGKNTFVLPQEVCERLADVEAINGPVKLGIAPADLKQEGEEGDLVIESTVDFTENYPRYIAVYSKLEGKKGFIVSKFPLDSTVTDGDKIKSFVSPKAIQLYDIETEEKLVAFKPISSNAADATVAVKEGVASISFGKSRLVMPTDNKIREGGQYKIHIDPKAVTVGKEAVSKAGKMVIVGSVLDADTLGDYTLVYLKVEGFEPYFTAQIKGAPTYNIGDKVKMAISPLGVMSGDKKSVATEIAERENGAVRPMPEVYIVKEEPKAAPKAEPKPVEETAAAEDAAEKKPAAKKATAAKKTTAAKTAPAAKTTAKKTTTKK